jgi:dienelactone hydrolase
MDDLLDIGVSPTGMAWPDALRMPSGQRICDPGQWPAQRHALAARMLPVVYGALPPTPAATRLTCLHSALVRRFGNARLFSCRVEPEAMAPFVLRLFVPAGHGPFAAIVNGDGCWHYADDAALGAMLARGYVFAQFNRVEIAADPDPAPDSALALPKAGARPCTLAAWAWAYHRVIDVLRTLDWIDGAALAVVGHSRGGKAALLAGATDERIALTSANNSGAGGAGSWRHRGPGAETLAELLRVYGHWFDPRLQAYAGREHELPFDQHFLKALVAPRALLTTEALDDHWANPQGSWQSHRAARPAFELLGAQARMDIVFRPGGHAHTTADWFALLDFADVVLRGMAQSRPPLADPYPDLPAPVHEQP